MVDVNQLLAERDARDKPILDIYKSMQGLYSPGGGYLSGIQAQLDRLQKQTMASGMSGMVSSGLAGTSMMGNLANKFAEETAAPTLAKAEAERISRLSDVMGQKASFLANRPGVSTSMRIGQMPSSISQSNLASVGSTGASLPTTIGPAYSGSVTKTQPLASLNLRTTSGTSLPQSLLASAQEPNWVTFNGKKYVEDPTTGQIHQVG